MGRMEGKYLLVGVKSEVRTTMKHQIPPNFWRIFVGGFLKDHSMGPFFGVEEVKLDANS